MRALVLEDSNYSGALSIVRALGRLRHDVTVLAPSPTPASQSRWCGARLLSPSPSHPGRYMAFLLSVVSQGAYDVAFVCDDPIVELVSHSRAALPSRPDFMLPPQPSLEIARSKLAAREFAADLGLPTPGTVALDTADRLERAARELDFPLVVKDDKGAGGHHVRYVADRDQLRRAYDHLTASRPAGRPMAQEFIPGEVFMPQVLYDRGRLVAICTHRKDRQFPLPGGVTAHGVTVNEPELDACVTRIFSALDWHGPAKADFKRDPRDGRFKLMELDGRFAATVGIAEAAGVDMVDIACRVAAGAGVSPVLHYAAGVRMRYFPRDLLCLAARPARLPAWVFDVVNPRLRSDFDWRDLSGTRALIRRTVWMFDDAWRTGEIAGERASEAAVRRGPPGVRSRSHRILIGLAGGALGAARAIYHAGKATARCGHTSGAPSTASVRRKA